MDEAQYEIRRSAVEFKTFPVKGDWEVMNEKGKMEESPEAKAARMAAKEFKESQTDKLWSDVMHTDKMYYVAYNRAGELAVESVQESGKYYKLNADLTAGYMVGTNWATCH